MEKASFDTMSSFDTLEMVEKSLENPLDATKGLTKLTKTDMSVTIKNWADKGGATNEWAARWEDLHYWSKDQRPSLSQKE